MKIKRILDLIFALILTIFLVPVFGVVALAIKLTSRGPVFFKQKRLGKDGRVFEIIKFRTMMVNAEKTGSGVYSLKDDPRVTKIGKVLRLTSIDELPQCINILLGHMSFIGPRPPLTYHPWSFEEYLGWQKAMFKVRPGVSGWAQVNGRKELDWDSRIKLSCWYVQNISFYLDVKIFFMTIWKILKMENNINVEKEKTAEGENTYNRSV